MGVLDDAIREHLELKRRHGATEDEIARAEAEALGPARREPGAEPLPEDELFGAGAETQLMEPPELPEDEFGPLESLHPDVENVPPAPEPPAPLGHDDTVTRVQPPSEPHGDQLVPPDSPLGLGGAEQTPAAPDEAPGTREGVEPPEPSTRPHGDPAFEDDIEPDEVPADEQLTRPAPLPPRDDLEGPPAPALPPDEPAGFADVESPAPVEEPPVEEPPIEEPPVEEPPYEAPREPAPEEQRGEDRLWFEQKPRRDFDFDD